MITTNKKERLLLQATTQVKDLSRAVSQVKNLTGAEHITLLVDSKGLHVAGTGKGTSVSLTIESEENKSGAVTLDFNLLSTALKGRKKVTLSVAGNQLVVKEGRYKGELTTLPLEEIEVKGNKAEPIKITAESQKILASAIDLIALNNVYTDDPMYVWVVSSKKALIVSCFDDFHMAHYQNNAANLGQINFQLSLQTFKTLNTLSNGKSYRLELSEGTLNAYSDLFKATMPLTQAGEGMSADLVKDYLSQLKVEGWFSVTSEKLKTFLENCAAGYDGQSTPLSIKPTPKGNIELAIDGNYAKVKEVMECTQKLKEGVSVDPKLLNDILLLVKDKEVKVEVSKSAQGRSITIKHEQGPVTVVYATTLV